MHVLLLLVLLGEAPEWLDTGSFEVGGFARGEHGWVSWSRSDPVFPPTAAHDLGKVTSHGTCGRFRVWSNESFVVAEDPNGRWQLVGELKHTTEHSVRCIAGVIVLTLRMVRDRSTDPWDTGWATPTRYVVFDPSARLHALVSWTQSADAAGPSAHVVEALLEETRAMMSRVRPRRGFTDRIQKIYERLDRAR